MRALTFVIGDTVSDFTECGHQQLQIQLRFNAVPTQNNVICSREHVEIAVSTFFVSDFHYKTVYSKN